MTKRLDNAYFERIYAGNNDPWNFESAWYERRKQALTMALLPQERYTSVFEPGCASGEITRLLSQRADRVLGLEPVARIAKRAAERLAGAGNVEVRTGSIPDDWPTDTFDLIVLSEVLYYCTAEGLTSVSELVESTLEPGGDVVAVHYLGETDYPLTGRQTHELLRRELDYAVVATYAEGTFHALVLRK